MSDVNKLREAGYTEDEIQGYLFRTRNKLKAGGYSQDEIDNYLGVRLEDNRDIKKVVSDLSKPEEKEKVCRWAYNAMFPFLTILEFDGKIPWEPDPERGYVACPDPHNIVVFELRREGLLETRESP